MNKYLLRAIIGFVVILVSTSALGALIEEGANLPGFLALPAIISTIAGFAGGIIATTLNTTEWMDYNDE